MPLLATIAALGIAAASGEGVAITWNGPARCADAVRMRATFDRLVGAPREDLRGSARVEVVEEGASLRARVVIEAADTPAERELQSTDCDALADAVALVVAVALDPLGASATVMDAMDEPAVHEVVPPPSLPRADEPIAAPIAPPRSSPRRERPPLSASVLLTGGGALGPLERVGMLDGGLGFGIASARLEVAAQHHFRTRVEHPDDPRVHADVVLTAGRVSAGWAPTVGRFWFPMLAGLELGAFTARADGITTSRTQSSLWAAVVPQFRPSVRIARWFALGLDLQLPIALRRARFGVSDYENTDLVRVGPLGCRVGLSLALTFFDENGRRRARRSREG